MPKIMRRRVGQLQRGAFKILIGHRDGLSGHEFLNLLAKLVPPSDFEKSEYPNHPGLKRFEEIVRLATIAPVKAGWLIKSKDQWSVTEKGKKAYERFQDPEKFFIEGGRLYSEWAESRPGRVTEVFTKKAR